MIDRLGRRIAVYGLALEGGAVLLARVAPTYPAAGMFTLPGGGMDWGETPRQALRREFEEETGLVPSIGDPILVTSRVWQADEEDGHTVHSLQIVFGAVASGPPRPERSGSTDHAEWISLADLSAVSVVPMVAEALALV